MSMTEVSIAKTRDLFDEPSLREQHFVRRLLEESCQEAAAFEEFGDVDDPNPLVAYEPPSSDDDD